MGNEKKQNTDPLDEHSAAVWGWEKDRIIPNRHRFVMGGKSEPALDTRTPGDKLAAQHVDWFLQTVRPLMIAEFLHGYKHGRDDERESADGK